MKWVYPLAVVFPRLWVVGTAFLICRRTRFSYSYCNVWEAFHQLFYMCSLCQYSSCDPVRARTSMGQLTEAESGSRIRIASLW